MIDIPKSSGGGGNGGRSGGGGGSSDAEIKQLSDEISKVKAGIKAIDTEISKLGYSAADRKLYMQLENAKDAAHDKIAGLDNKRYELTHNPMSSSEYRKIAEARETSDTNFQAKFAKEQLTKKSPVMKRFKEERFYSDETSKSGYKG